MKQALQLSFILAIAGVLFSCSANQAVTKRYSKIPKITVDAKNENEQSAITSEAFSEVKIKTASAEKIKHNKKASNAVVILDQKETKKTSKPATETAIAKAPKIGSVLTGKDIAIDKIEEYFADQNSKMEMQRPQGRSRWAYAITSLVTAVLSGLMLPIALLASFPIGAVFGGALAIIAVIFGSLGLARKWKASRIVSIIGLALGALLLVGWIIIIALYAVAII